MSPTSDLARAEDRADGNSGNVICAQPPRRGRPLNPGQVRRRARWPFRTRWVRRHSVLLAVVATLVAHLASLTQHLGSDEGGYAMVARHWNQPGGYLYGPQWVDRPPGLIALFAVADHLGPYGVRIAASLVAATLVVVIACAADAVGGSRAARWAAWTGFAFASSVLLSAQQLNGEL